METVDDQAGGEADDAESRLPQLTQGQRVDATELTPDGHSTNPPARYTEASLIKALEELGIGRPSTYSSIIKTIQDRGYVHKKGSALVPSWVAFAVTGLLEQHFGRLVDYGFTAAMEDELDAIASGTERRSNWLNNFYFGGDHGVADSIARSGGLKKLVGVNLEGIDAREVNSIKLFDDAEGRAVNVRVGRNGPYLERMVVGDDGEPTPQRANLHDSLTPDELTLDVAEELFATPQEGRSLGRRPGVRARNRRQGRPLRSVRHRGAAQAGGRRRRHRRATGEEGQEAHRPQAAHRIAAAQHGPADGHARGRAEAAVVAAGGRRRPRIQARRSPRRTAATAHTSSAAPTLAHWPPRTRSSTSPSKRR